MEIKLKYNTVGQYINRNLKKLITAKNETKGKSERLIRTRKNNTHDKEHKIVKSSTALSEKQEGNFDEKIRREFKHKIKIKKTKRMKINKNNNLQQRQLNLELTESDTKLFEMLENHENDSRNYINKSLRGLFISGVVFHDFDKCGYVCGFCFKQFIDPFQFDYHCQIASCPMKITYDENDSVIYEDKVLGISIKRLDGLLDSITCNNLTKLGKLFISHKLNNEDDIVKFEFFVLYEGDRFVGYFSREKSSSSWNLSCILTVPKRNTNKKVSETFLYGQFLIHFAYQLSILQTGSFGTPEKPFSDLGLLAFRKYYKFRLLKFLIDEIDIDNIDLAEVSFWELSRMTGMVKNDLIFALESLGDFEYSSSLKKMKIKKSLIDKWKQNSSYKEWRRTINQFEIHKFTNIFKYSLKNIDSYVLINKDSNYIKKKLEETKKEDWQTVLIPTEKYIYIPVDAKTHQSYIDSM
ncbi:hypothetical protein QEN19_003477 [Hanseniaspora menglaensis]